MSIDTFNYLFYIILKGVTNMLINLRLKGPLQSWGDQSRTHTAGKYRGTSEFPTYSGIFGLLCNCCGLNRNRDFDDYMYLFNSLEYISAVAVKQFSILIDNQNIGGGYKSDDPIERMYIPRTVKGTFKGSVGWKIGMLSNSELSDREYLEDADFIVTINITDNELALKVIEYLKNPVWVPSLGRECCIPSYDFFISTYSSYTESINDAKTILNSDRLIAYMSEKPSGKYYTLDMYDVPVLTQAFKYTRRKVYKTVV